MLACVACLCTKLSVSVFFCSELARHFPAFIWVLRDFVLQLQVRYLLSLFLFAFLFQLFLHFCFSSFYTLLSFLTLKDENGNPLTSQQYLEQALQVSSYLFIYLCVSPLSAFISLPFLLCITHSVSHCMSVTLTVHHSSRQRLLCLAYERSSMRFDAYISQPQKGNNKRVEEKNRIRQALTSVFRQRCSSLYFSGFLFLLDRKQVLRNNRFCFRYSQLVKYIYFPLFYVVRSSSDVFLPVICLYHQPPFLSLAWGDSDCVTLILVL